MTSPPRGPLSDEVLAREAVATERRHWVRLTRRCNNHCLFCHDIGRHDGSIASIEEIRAALHEGRERSATRLVLSGGEPTIHPRFLEAVQLGRELGYEWIQAISNGRMFAYPRFVADAVAAGLDEATLSIHGHTPELHDTLAGAQGAFAQAIRGLGNLQRAGRVVSVDVVVCRPNVRHLAEILRFLMRLGVREFDLLHLVPFGRAFDEQRSVLEFDPAAERPHLVEALGLARLPGVHIWTNRWPAPLLEGAEQLIQDPHKILDEVRGMSRELGAYLETGALPPCHGERCRRCFVEALCRALGEHRARLLDGTFPVVALDAAAAGSLANAARAALERQRSARLRLRAPDVETATAALAACPRGDVAELELDAERLGAPSRSFAERLRRVVVRRDEDLDVALSLRGVELEVPLRRGTAALARRALDAARDRVVLRAPGRPLLSEVVAEDLAPAELAGLALDARAEGIARCLAPRATVPDPVLDAADLDARGGLDLFALTARWVRDGYRTRSLRCADCAEASACGGAHVNVVRAHGFAWMRPVPTGGGA
jgi:pyruvate-formate lyase-activating enzyme